jgi:hypothetical protein
LRRSLSGLAGRGGAACWVGSVGVLAPVPSVIAGDAAGSVQDEKEK